MSQSYILLKSPVSGISLKGQDFGPNIYPSFPVCDNISHKTRWASQYHAALYGKTHYTDNIGNIKTHWKKLLRKGTALLLVYVHLFPPFFIFFLLLCSVSLYFSAPADLLQWDLCLYLPSSHAVFLLSFLHMAVPGLGSGALAGPAPSPVATPAGPDQSPALKLAPGCEPSLHSPGLVQLLGTEGRHPDRNRVPELGVIYRVAAVLLAYDGHKAPAPQDLLRGVGCTGLHGDACSLHHPCQSRKNTGPLISA